MSAALGGAFAETVIAALEDAEVASEATTKTVDLLSFLFPEA
jgi:hypothetical protein